jgi:hypothetical protein
MRWSRYPQLQSWISAGWRQIAVETDWLAGAGGFEPLHFRIGFTQSLSPGAGSKLLCMGLIPGFRLYPRQTHPLARCARSVA